jgi:hypothetical protein
VSVGAVIAADLATANGASALAGTSPSIQIKKSARIARELADAPPVATPELSRLAWLMIDPFVAVKVLVGAEEMQRMMIEAIGVAKQA